MKKVIKFVNNVGVHKVNDEANVIIHQFGVIGAFDRYPQDNTMDGSLNWSALVEFNDGRIVPFEIDWEIIIIGDWG